MEKVKVDIKLLDNAKVLGINAPQYGTVGSAGVDLCAAINAEIVVKPMMRVLVPTGLAISLPIGFEAQVRPRSGLALKHGIGILNSPGTIDSDYRGEISVIIINYSDEDFKVEPKMRIAQMIINRYVQVEWDVVDDLNDTQRGHGGFGSTGTN